jgi:hypothetical protein
MANQLHSLPRIIVLESEHAQEGWPRMYIKETLLTKMYTPSPLLW